ncbi:shikimate dehydrogenase family protein [Eubacterium xylanophilum]|uniref:shikimate dehydrogenase family protein n=1 Tax=Eubacterium xylanophilum TaxID=39497 RepID=UPI0004B5B76B|nr:shikimate dehydrogenase [Eubacterium xylanophilum]
MKYGLIGEKLGHSYSKQIHELLTDYTYEPTPLTREEFEEFMSEKDFTAINVTIPYKKDVIPYLSYIDDKAKAIGAVNTIVNRNNELYGYNTDYLGFDYMAKANNVDFSDKKVIVIGNGGAAQAIKAVVTSCGAKEMIIVKSRPDVESISYEECYKNHTDADIIINTSPVGMYPNVNASPIELDCFKKCSAVLDVVANPLETMLVKDAKKRGMIAAGGLVMLVAQAKYAAEIFLDASFPDEKIPEITEIIAKEMEE